MRFFKQNKSSESDYKNLLDVFAEMEINSFDQLSNSEKKEIIASWIACDENEDEVINMLINFKRSKALEEAMYESKTAKTLGESLIHLMLTDEHIKSINIDMDEAFTDYVMSLDGYTSDEDELRKADNLDRLYGLNKVTHQRMGI